jgi:hypothetical protein
LGLTRGVMIMTRENFTLILSAIGAAEGTLSLLIAIMGVLAGFIVAIFVAGVLSGTFITYYMLAREDS